MVGDTRRVESLYVFTVNSYVLKFAEAAVSEGRRDHLADVSYVLVGQLPIENREIRNHQYTLIARLVKYRIHFSPDKNNGFFILLV